MLSLPRAQVQSLVGEIRSHKLRGIAKNKNKTKQIKKIIIIVSDYKILNVLQSVNQY